MNVRGLTCWQPMAWAISAKEKPIENRTRPPVRGVTHLALHAGLTFHREHVSQIRSLGIAVPPKAELVFGAIICVARIAAVVTSYEGAVERCGVDGAQWFSGPFGYVLEDVVPIEPITCRGAQGMWKLPDPVVGPVQEAILSCRP